jgi:hypothetical protein
MSDEESKVFWIFIIPITWASFFGIGWCTGNDVTVKDTRQTLCREFIKETNNYINCNTKGLDEVIKMIKNKK